MPVYIYKCLGCNKTNEFVRSVKDRGQEIICPKCDSVDMQRVFTVPSYSRMSESIVPSCYTEKCNHPEDYLPDYDEKP
jgi:putative FmdB family regulatory protein